MIEKNVYEYLKTALAPIEVVTEIRQGMPSKFIFIEKTGSSMRDRLKVARIAVQSYGPTLFDAAALNGDVVEAMLNMVSEAEVSNVELNSDYNYTDMQTKTPRYQAVFEISHY